MREIDDILERIEILGITLKVIKEKTAELEDKLNAIEKELKR